MPADETVTLDREAVMDLLVEVQTVTSVLERIAGVCPTRLTTELIEKSERIAEALLGDTQDGPGGEIVGPRVDLWDAGDRGADAFARSLVHGEDDDAR